MRVLRRVTSGAFRYSSANSRARLSALPLGHNFGHYPPFLCGARRQRLRVQQEGLRSSRPSAITPVVKIPSPGTTPAGEVGHVLKGRALRRHNDIGK